MYYIYIQLYTYPLPLKPPSLHPSRSSQSIRLGSLCYIAASSYLFIHGGICTSMLLSQVVLASLFPAVSTSPLSRSASPFLLCKNVPSLLFFQIPCSLRPHGLQPARLLRDSPGKNTGVGSHSLLQRIFSTQGSKRGLLHCRWIPYHLSRQGSPYMS